MATKDKKKVESRIQQAHYLFDSGQKEAAQELADELAGESFDDPLLDGALAFLHERLGYSLSAIALYHKALQGRPDDPVLMSSLSKAYINTKQYAEADAWLTKALAIHSECAEAVAGRANLLLATNQYEKAVEWLEKAIRLHSTDISVHINLPIVLGIIGQHDKAMDRAERTLRRFPKNPIVLYAAARTYGAAGQMDKAERTLLKAIQIDPSYGAAYRQLSFSKRFTEKDIPLIGQAEAQLHKSMTATNKADILFALGKMHDDLHNYDKAFGYFQQANLLTRRSEKPDDQSSLVKLQKKIFTHGHRNNPDNHPADGTCRPVFVVGMPRSGTTLIEQIITSHPKAAGAGELPEINRIAKTLYLESRKKSFFGMETFAMPDKPFWQEHRKNYLDVLQEGRKDAECITDKMPSNYHYLGLIHFMFPDAVILHVVRQPLDVCLSCYFQAFLGLPWSNDLTWIAETYRDYRKLMAMWKRVLPAGKIHDVYYEELIAQPELESRRLIDVCGLEWDPACLDHARNSRSIQTASVWQVRQPIYQTSKMRWVNYAPYIGELAQGIAEYLDDADIEILAQHGVKIRRKHWKFL